MRALQMLSLVDTANLVNFRPLELSLVQWLDCFRLENVIFQTSLLAPWNLVIPNLPFACHHPGNVSLGCYDPRKV